MKERYEVDNNLTQDKTVYEKEKLTKELKLVRNEFKTIGKYGMPLIKKQEIDLEKIDLWNYTKTKLNDDDNKNKTIHFFTYDWLFENVYDKPELAMEKLKQYYAVLSPEFSLYWDMPKALQIYSTFKNRWCEAFYPDTSEIKEQITGSYYQDKLKKVFALIDPDESNNAKTFLPTGGNGFI